MTYPWLEIPISEYEAHMESPSVGQAQLLAATLQRVVSTFQPGTLAILGAAGGNGLERVDPAIVRRVVALDFNPEFLTVCEDRYGGSFVQFEPILHDLSQGPPTMEPVECVFAGLVLEYLLPEPFFAYLPSLLACGGVFAAVLQLPSPSLPEVSASRYHSLGKLQSVFSFVRPESMHNGLKSNGFSFIEDERVYLPSGKSFYFGVYRRSRQPG
jgi:hypothetical protein